MDKIKKDIKVEKGYKEFMVRLITLNTSIREKENQLNLVVDGDFSVDPNCEFENIILDLMGFPEEGEGRSKDYVEDDFGEKNAMKYGFCRDLLVDFLGGTAYDKKTGKMITDKVLSPDEIFEELMAELETIKK